MDKDFVYDLDNEVSYERSKHARSQHWTDPEDEILRQLVAEHGAFNWPFIASLMVNREAKQCRERWLYHLSPDIKKGKLSEKEWIKVQQLQKQLGNKWSEIAKHVPGRSPNQIKNHWHSHNRNDGSTARRRTRPSKELKRQHSDAFENDSVHEQEIVVDSDESLDNSNVQHKDKRFKVNVDHEGTDTDDTATTTSAVMSPAKGASSADEGPAAFMALLAAIDAEDEQTPQGEPTPTVSPLPLQTMMSHQQQFYSQPQYPYMPSMQEMMMFRHQAPTPTSSAGNTPMASPVLHYEMQPPFPITMPMMASPSMHGFMPFTAY